MTPAKNIEPILHDEDERTRLLERADGFYWQNKMTGKMYGPFPTLAEAVEDAELVEESTYEEGDALHEAEEEIGIADWVNPDTGELAEGATIPHFND